MATCPIWGTSATEYLATNDRRELVSARAGGTYAVAASAEPLLTELTHEQKELLTSWLADERGKGNACPLVTAQLINSLPG